MSWTALEGDALELLRTFEPESFDAVVTDPPYGLEFMGKDWDSYTANGYQDWCERWASECLRVLKPGGHLLAFGGTRTYHRMACAIEDAGFEIRDSLHWIYGSGFPKSRDISKAIDKEAGAEREVTGKRAAKVGFDTKHEGGGGWAAGEITDSAPATEQAQQWEGWGTALKPAHEPIIVARKPLGAKLTVAGNVLEYGTGAVNIDACRVAGEKVATTYGSRNAIYNASDSWESHDAGRWPPNVVFTHAPGCRPTGETRKLRAAYRPDNRDVGSPDKDVYGAGLNQRMSPAYGDESGSESVVVWDCADGCPVRELDSQSGVTKQADTGGASRFFPCFRYQAKAPKKERPVAWLPSCDCGDAARVISPSWSETSACGKCGAMPRRVSHATVKPVALMRWLVRLVTPPGGYVLDPFGGTGTTAEACEIEGFDVMLIERDPDSIRLISERMIAEPLPLDEAA